MKTNLLKKINNRSYYFLPLLLTLVLLAACTDEEETPYEVNTLINFSDDFSDVNSGWYVYTNDVSSQFYTDQNTYEIKAKNIDLICSAMAPIERLKPNYNIEVQLNHLQMDGNAGLVFNGIENGDLSDYYLFQLKPYAGRYRISRKNELSGDDWTHLTEWELCYPHLNEPNTISLSQNQDIATFYLNGDIIEEISGLPTHPEGVNVGIFVSSFETGTDTLTTPIICEFDDFEVSGNGVE